MEKFSLVPEEVLFRVKAPFFNDGKLDIVFRIGVNPDVMVVTKTNERSGTED